MTLIIVGALLLVTNLISFSLMAYDKQCARKGKWRVSEKALFIAAACFGASEAFLACFCAITKQSTGTSGCFSRCSWSSRPVFFLPVIGSF